MLLYSRHHRFEVDFWSALLHSTYSTSIRHLTMLKRRARVQLNHLWWCGVEERAHLCIAVITYRRNDSDSGGKSENVRIMKQNDVMETLPQNIEIWKELEWDGKREMSEKSIGNDLKDENKLQTITRCAWRILPVDGPACDAHWFASK